MPTKPLTERQRSMDDIRPEVAAIVEKIDQLRPLLQESGAEGERLRRIPDEVFNAIAETGAWSISVPSRFGGLAANTRECNAVARAIAWGDGGAGWVTGIFDSSAWLLGLMDEKAQEDVWGNGKDVNKTFVNVVLAQSSDVERVEGGYRVTGRWGYGTGSLHTDWSILGIPMKDEQGNVIDAGLALFPKSDLTEEDNWFVSGMKTTGSVMQIANDVFVPDYRVLPLTAAMEGGYVSKDPEQTFTTVFVPSLFMKLIGPHLGMGRAALDYVMSKADSKGVAYTGYTKQSDAVSFQLAVAKAAVKLDAAELVAADIADEIFENAARDYYSPYAERLAMHARAGWVVDTVTEVIDSLMTAHGSSGFAESSPLQRIWRDQAMAARHGHTLSSSGYEAYGKILFGLEDGARFVFPIC